MYIIEAEGADAFYWWECEGLRTALKYAKEHVSHYQRILVYNPEGAVIWGR